MGIGLTVDDDVKGGGALRIFEDRGSTVGVTVQTIGEHRTGQVCHRIHGAGIIRAGDDVPCGGNQLRKLPEGMLDVVQVLEKIQVICLNIQNHFYSRIK